MHNALEGMVLIRPRGDSDRATARGIVNLSYKFSFYLFNALHQASVSVVLSCIRHTVRDLLTLAMWIIMSRDCAATFTFQFLSHFCFFFVVARE
jgi:hypothetical protein